MDVREAWASPRCLAAWSAKEDRDAALSSSPLAVPASSSLLLVLSFPSTNSSSVSASTQCATSQHQLPKVKNINPSPSPCLFLSTLTHPHPSFPLNMVSSQPDVPYVAPGSKAQTISADLGEKKTEIVIKQKMHREDRGYVRENWTLLEKLETLGVYLGVKRKI